MYLKYRVILQNVSRGYFRTEYSIRYSKMSQLKTNVLQDSRCKRNFTMNIRIKKMVFFQKGGEMAGSEHWTVSERRIDAQLY